MLDAQAPNWEARERRQVLVVARRSSPEPCARPRHRHVAEVGTPALRGNAKDMIEAESRSEDRQLRREALSRGSREGLQGRRSFCRNAQACRPELVDHRAFAMARVGEPSTMDGDYHGVCAPELLSMIKSEAMESVTIYVTKGCVGHVRGLTDVVSSWVSGTPSGSNASRRLGPRTDEEVEALGGHLT